MDWHFHSLTEKIRQRKNQKFCERCGLLYKKTLNECIHCFEIDDQRLVVLLEKRKKLRLNIARGMFVGVGIILFLLLF